MGFRSYIISGLIFVLLIAAFPLRAQTLNCDTLPELAGNRRDRPAGSPDQHCLLWDQSTETLKIYYPPPLKGEDNVTDEILLDLREAVDLTLLTYRKNGFMAARPQPPIQLWISRARTTLNNDADSNAFGSATSPCVINVYWRVIASGGYTSDEFHQILAHEIFHCVQMAQLDKPYNPATYWWMEGSAEWASGIVYPAVNVEYWSSRGYHQHELLFDQCDPGLTGECGKSIGIYATALFFQDMANQQGNSAVFDLFLRMPADQEGQFQAFSEAPGIDQVFKKFSQDYIDGEIKDPGGGFMDQPEVIYSDDFEVSENQDIEIQGTPLMIYAYKIKFTKGKIYELTGLQDQDRFKLFLKRDGGWTGGDNAAPIKFNAGCSDISAIIALSSAENTRESQSFTLHVKVLKETMNAALECPCDCAAPVPACVVGNWRSDTAPQLDLFINNLMNVSKSGQNGASFENGQARVDRADLQLNVSEGGGFDHSTAISYHGKGTVNGQAISMTGGIKSSSAGSVCLTQENQLCMQYESQTLPVPMQITAMGMTIPIAGRAGTYSGSITMPYICTATELTLKPTLQGEGPVATQEVTITYHK